MNQQCQNYDFKKFKCTSNYGNNATKRLFNDRKHHNTPGGSLTTLSCQDNTLTTQESSTSKSTMVSPQKGTTYRATHLPEIDATSEVPGKSTNKGKILYYKVKMFNTLCSLYIEVCVCQMQLWFIM